MNIKIKNVNKKTIKSGFGIFKGMRSFTKEDELNSCIDTVSYKKFQTKQKIKFQNIKC